MPGTPRPLVICGPSGSGKSTLYKKLTTEYDQYFGFSVSHTTRGPRTGEVDGKDYHFADREEMKKEIADGKFIESAEFSGNLYGTSKCSVQTTLNSGKICILDIDVQGVKQVKEIPELNPHYLFIKPPSLDVLEQRLRDRGTETEESIARRLEAVQREMDYGEEEGNFDEIIVNDDLEEAYEKLKQFILPEIEKLQMKNGEEEN